MNFFWREGLEFSSNFLGDLFFIIKSGDVRITIDETGGEKEVATKHKGDYFGMKFTIKIK